MRLLALGDTQIGVTTVTLESQAQVLDRIADAAIENRVDLVLHGGDVFEGPQVTPEHLAVFRSFVARLREASIPLLAITGNGSHDAAMRAVNGLAIFDDIPGITVSNRPQVGVRAGANVLTLPWTSPAGLIAATNGSVDRDRANDYVASLLVQRLRDQMDELARDRARILTRPDSPTILLSHWSISGASLPTGLPVDQLREPVIEWADLDALGFDCVIASHIHKAQRLDHPELGDKTPGVYTGSPQPLNHGEGGYEHGCWLVDVEPGTCVLEFLPIESPRFVTLGPGGWSPSQVEDAIVRLQYTATREEDASYDKDHMRRELLAAGASRVTIEPTITREVRARSEAVTQELSEVDALALYCVAQGIDPAMGELMAARFGEWIA